MNENDVEKAKRIIKKFDPALVAIAVQEISMKARRIEKEDVEKAKEKIKELYESLPATKDRAGIISRALEEVDTEVIGKEIDKIKTELKVFDREVLLEASKDLELKYCLTRCISYFIGPCYCYDVICLHRCIRYRIAPPCPGGCIHYMIFGCGAYDVTPLPIDPSILVARKELREEIVREVLENPEVSRAIKKMITEMKKKGEL